MGTTFRNMTYEVYNMSPKKRITRFLLTSEYREARRAFDNFHRLETLDHAAPESTTDVALREKYGAAETIKSQIVRFDMERSGQIYYEDDYSDEELFDETIPEEDETTW